MDANIVTESRNTSANDEYSKTDEMTTSYNSLLYHMEQKYLSEQDVESFIDIFGTSPCKVANEKGLELLVLDRCNISDVGDVERFSAFVQNVTELDLSWNSIKSWSTIATLLSAMPVLKLLNLSHNPIETREPQMVPSTDETDCVKRLPITRYTANGNTSIRFSSRRRSLHRRRNSTGEIDEASSSPDESHGIRICDPPVACSSSCEDMFFRYDDDGSSYNSYSIPTCSKLSTLILNGVRLPLRVVRRFVSAMPMLRELHLAENAFSSEDLAASSRVPFSETVTLLNLNGCEIEIWDVVLRFLKLFPNIVHLFVADNRFTDIDFSPRAWDLDEQKVSYQIRSITLSGNSLSSWRSIESLAQLRQLEELRIRNVPLFDTYSDEERRHLVVGRLRSIISLNGSIITAAQREESERFFIRFYQNSSERPWIYEELVARHGHLEQLVKVDLTPRRFADVALRCDETGYYTRARIRLACTVLDLMRHSEKVTGIGVARQRLFYNDGNASGPAELRFPHQTLKSLHIEDGDEFFIQSKILPLKPTPTKHQKQID